MIVVALGSVPSGIAPTIAVVVTPLVPGLLTNRATVASLQTDSQPANNSASVVSTASLAASHFNLQATVVSPLTLNPQTGLYEQQVQVNNFGGSLGSGCAVAGVWHHRRSTLQRERCDQRHSLRPKQPAFTQR